MLNRAILVPRRRKPHKYTQTHWAACAIRCIKNYCYYRKQGICVSVSWALARHTL